MLSGSWKAGKEMIGLMISVLSLTLEKNWKWCKKMDLPYWTYTALLNTYSNNLNNIIDYDITNDKWNVSRRIMQCVNLH